MDTVEVKLLNYKFKFHQLRWREEFNIKFDPKKDRLRTILAHALAEVSGIKVNSVEDAERVLMPIPSAVIYRIFVVYKGTLPPARLFKTVGLYKAPEPSRLIKRIQEAEEEREQVMDRVERDMEAKFGRKELQEARQQELEMLKNSRGRGLTRATDEGSAFGTKPPVNPSARIKVNEP
jgi:hypothetical protein